MFLFTISILIPPCFLKRHHLIPFKGSARSKGRHRELKARGLSKNQAFSQNRVLKRIDKLWRRSACSGWRVITEQVLPPGTLLSASPIKNVHYERYRFHYSCVSQGWRILMNPRWCKRSLRQQTASLWTRFHLLTRDAPTSPPPFI